MYAVLALMLVSVVGQSLASFDCSGDLVIYRCDYYTKDYGDAYQRTCEYPDGDPNVNFDCKLEPVMCTCPYGQYLYDTDGDTCVSKCDTTPPTVQCPNIDVPTPDDGISLAVYYSIICEDTDGYADLSCDVPTGSIFTLDQPKRVECWCIDESHNVADCDFTVTVFDDKDPDIQCNEDIEQSAGDSGTANVDFAAPSCSDNSGVYTVSCDYDSGVEFSIGETTVTCECVDAAGNQDECDFTITVIDDSDPDIQCNEDIEQSAGSSGTANVDFAAPSCSDNSGVYTASCDYDSGVEFSIGETTVTCECVDAAGNQDECYFTITVIDDTEPQITCVNPELFFASPPSYTAPVSWETPTCNDNSGGELTVTCDQVPGDWFLGWYDIYCTCDDEAGNQDSCSIGLEVEGVTELNCPEEETYEIDNKDPEDTIILQSELKLSKDGLYEIVSIARPIGDTYGEELSCTHTVSVI